MFVTDEVNESSRTEHRPVHVVLPSPVSWVSEVRPSSGKTAPEKRSPGTNRFSPRLGNAVHRRQGKRAPCRDKEALLSMEEQAARMCET